MIPLLGSAFCYAAFLVFETFALALERLSPIKLRGLLEEHPERARILSGPGEAEIVRTTTKVLVQVLLVLGLISLVAATASFADPPRLGVGRRRLPGRLAPDRGRPAVPRSRRGPREDRRASPAGRRGGLVVAPARGHPGAADLREARARHGGHAASRSDGAGSASLHRGRARGGHSREGRGEAAPLDRGLRRHPCPRGDDAADRHRLDRRGFDARRPSRISSCPPSTLASPSFAARSTRWWASRTSRTRWRRCARARHGRSRSSRARPTSCRRPRRWRSCCASSRGGGSGWPSSWTSTAACPGWPRWRTCWRRSSGRSATSTRTSAKA